ncbi:MAG: NAD-binding protein [Thermomicrobiales bacterium]
MLVIERDGSVVERIEDRLGSIVMQGDGAESSILDAAGASRADVIIASTGDDEDNLIVCLPNGDSTSSGDRQSEQSKE